MFDKAVVGSYLNIVEYKHKKLMEMIGMAEKAKCVLHMHKEEIENKKEIEMAGKLNGKLSFEEIAKVTGLSLNTVLLL
jgi:hypothetical protein